MLPHLALALLLPFFSFAADKQRKYEFIPNQGQWNREIDYAARINSGKLFFAGTTLKFNFIDNSSIENAHTGHSNVVSALTKGHVYTMSWKDAIEPEYIPLSTTRHYYNYFIGKDQTKWKGGVHATYGLRLKNIYTGIDVDYFTSPNEKMEYTYTVKAGYDASQIQQQYFGAEVFLSKKGDLVITTSVNTVTESAPTAYQIVGGKKKVVKCRFQLTGNTVTYLFPEGYNRAVDLIIDPTLIFGSYSGSTADNFGMTATYDEEGHLYAGGITYDIGYPTTTGAYDTTSNPDGSTYGITDVVLTKYLPDGTDLVYSTYLGGGATSLGTETVHSLIVNSAGELMCFGATSSTDFPTTAGAYSSTHNGGSLIQFLFNGVYFLPSGTDIYVTKFNPAGTALIGSTLIGGSGNDGVNYKVTSGSYSSVAAYDSLTTNYGDQFRGEIMIDEEDNIYVASTTRSIDFPVVNAFQPTKGAQSDAVVFKFNPTLTTLLFSTYLGGSGMDAGYSVKLDGSGNVFVCGGTGSSDFPTTAGTLNTTYQGGKVDGFVAKIDNSGGVLMASSYIGTNVYDQAFFVEVDKDDKVYLYGQTLGTTTFPIVSAGYSNPNSGQYILRCNNALTSLEFSTLFGNGSGTVNISPSAFLVDVCGNVYISGWGNNILLGTGLTGMPVTPGAFQTSSGDGYNFYLACFERNMSGLLYATYFGGNISQEHVDGGTSRFDKFGIVYQSVCAGCGGNDDFPTTPGAWSNTNNSSNCNNGVFKFDFEISPVADFTTDVVNGCTPLTVNFINTSPPDQDYLWDFGNGDTSSVIYSPTITYTDTGTYVVYLITEDSICGLIDTAMQIIEVVATVDVNASSDTFFCAPATLTLISNALGGSVAWSNDPSFSDTLNLSPSDVDIVVNINSDSTFYVSVYNEYCNKVDTVNIFYSSLSPQITGLNTLCVGDSTVLIATNSVPGLTYLIDWSPNTGIVSGDGTSTIVVSPGDSTTYTVVFTTPSGCSDTASYDVNVVDPAGAGFIAWPDDYVIFSGDSTLVHVIPATAVTYSWTPPTNLSHPDSTNSYAFPPSTTIYSVTGDFGTCSITDTLIIRVVDFICDEKYVYLPNAFTPNGDGINDVLMVRTSDKVQIYLAVFERWGEKVFETSDKNLGWDGKVNGRDADPAVFDYYLKAVCPGGQEFFKKGNITLIR